MTDPIPADDTTDRREDRMRKAALEAVAAHWLLLCVRRSRRDEIVSWEDYPNLSPTDYQAVVDTAEQMALGELGGEDAHRPAYRYLAARADKEDQ
jgi:hypothetical protein